MRKFLTIFALGLLLTAPGLRAQNIKFLAQWIPQSQFAGFYMAIEKGYFADEGLDVEILHHNGKASAALVDRLLDNEVQIAGHQMLQSMISRSDGAEIVNVMQITQNTGLMAVSRTPINLIADLDGKRVGKWHAGFSELCEIIENYSGIKVDWVPFVNGTNLYVYGVLDATLCFSYSEYLNLKMAIGDIPEENCVRMKDLNIPRVVEDGLYVSETYYKDNKDTVDKFVRAAKKGWDYTREHVDEAVDITMRWCNNLNVSTNRVFQKMMLEEYLDLQVNDSTGKADYAQISEESFNVLMQVLMDTGLIVNKVEYKDMIR